MSVDFVEDSGEEEGSEGKDNMVRVMRGRCTSTYTIPKDRISARGSLKALGGSLVFKASRGGEKQSRGELGCRVRSTPWLCKISLVTDN